MKARAFVPRRYSMGDRARVPHRQLVRGSRRHFLRRALTSKAGASLTRMLSPVETESQSEGAVEPLHLLATERTNPRLEPCLVDRRDVVGVAPACLRQAFASPQRDFGLQSALAARYLDHRDLRSDLVRKVARNEDDRTSPRRDRQGSPPDLPPSHQRFAFERLGLPAERFAAGRFATACSAGASLHGSQPATAAAPMAVVSRISSAVSGCFR